MNERKMVLTSDTTSIQLTDQHLPIKVPADKTISKRNY